MEFEEIYNNYPYKKLYAPATTFNYPIETLTELLESLNDNYFDNTNKETYIHMLLVMLKMKLDYTFTNNGELFDKIHSLRNIVREGSMIHFICDTVLKNTNK